jgi:hypothetical protein
MTKQVAQAIAQLIADKARNTKNTAGHQLHHAQINFGAPLSDWKNAQFEALALKIDVSTNTLKCILALPTCQTPEQLQPKTQAKVCTFLGCIDWAEVTAQAEAYIHQVLLEKRAGL